MSVASWSGSLLSWERELTALKARVCQVLGRRELRETGSSFIDGLLSGVERKTGWLMAEQSGADQPYRMQSLLGRSQWDADRLRDEVRDYVVEALGDADGVLIVDETGFVKKGEHSAGVARQYSGTAGRIENSQIGVFVAYASRYGQALIDRQLYLPESWTNDRDRCAKASIPETVGFATKPKMARAMIEKALDAGVPCAYVLGDAVYGADSSLRRMLENRHQPYVLAVRGAHFMRRGGERLFEGTSPEELVAELAPEAWACHAAGEGAKGMRLYDWACIRRPWTSDQGFEHWLLMELIAYRGLNDLDFSISYWRTKSGFKVDFILGNAEVAIEAKISNHVDKTALRGLEAFVEEHQPKQAYCVSLTPKARKISLSNGAHVIDLPWQDFIQKLWNKEII